MSFIKNKAELREEVQASVTAYGSRYGPIAHFFYIITCSLPWCADESEPKRSTIVLSAQALKTEDDEIVRDGPPATIVTGSVKYTELTLGITPEDLPESHQSLITEKTDLLTERTPLPTHGIALSLLASYFGLQPVNFTPGAQNPVIAAGQTELTQANISYAHGGVSCIARLLLASDNSVGFDPNVTLTRLSNCLNQIAYHIVPNSDAHPLYVGSENTKFDVGTSEQNKLLREALDKISLNTHAEAPCPDSQPADHELEEFRSILKQAADGDTTEDEGAEDTPLFFDLLKQNLNILPPPSAPTPRSTPTPAETDVDQLSGPARVARGKTARVDLTDGQPTKGTRTDGSSFEIGGHSAVAKQFPKPRGPWEHDEAIEPTPHQVNSTGKLAHAQHARPPTRGKRPTPTSADLLATANKKIRYSKSSNEPTLIDEERYFRHEQVLSRDGTSRSLQVYDIGGQLRLRIAGRHRFQLGVKFEYAEQAAKIKDKIDREFDHIWANLREDIEVPCRHLPVQHCKGRALQGDAAHRRRVCSQLDETNRADLRGLENQLSANTATVTYSITAFFKGLKFHVDKAADLQRRIDILEDSDSD